MPAIGIDADHDALRRHRGLNDKVLGNIEHLPFADRAFDLDHGQNMVVEHVSDASSPSSRRVHRILAPGGRLILHTPNGRGYTTLLTRLIPERRRAALAKLLLRAIG